MALGSSEGENPPVACIGEFDTQIQQGAYAGRGIRVGSLVMASTDLAARPIGCHGDLSLRATAMDSGQSRFTTDFNIAAATGFSHA